MSPYRGSAVARLNAVLASVCDADVTLFFIVPQAFPRYLPFEIPPFRLGRLRSDKLRHRSEKAGSDYYERYREKFHGAWAVERDPKSVRVLDLMSVRNSIFDTSPLRREREPWEFEAWDATIQGYFSTQNQVLFDEFLLELLTAQDPFVTLGAPFFDPQVMRNVFWRQQVAIFLNIDPKGFGFVAPAGVGGIHVDWTNAHLRVRVLSKELNEQYGFREFDSSPLHGSIRLFASFVARARRHQTNGNPDEALLHFIIALELIFGVREAIQRSVSERVAVITFMPVGRSFDHQRAWINRIYDLRSQYVHAGVKLTDEGALEEMYVLCQHVFRCLLRLQAANPEAIQRKKETLAQWLTLLDFLSKGIIAGQNITQSQFQNAFIV